MNSQIQKQLEKDLAEIQAKISELVQDFDSKYYLKGYRLSIEALYDKGRMAEHKSRALCKAKDYGNLNWM